MSFDASNIPQIVSKCQEHKVYNIQFAKKIWSAYPGDVLASRIYSCSSRISTRGNSLVASSFCRERFCPVCQWRRAQKFSYQNDLVFDHLISDHRFILLTLTMKSVPLSGLRSAVEQLQAANKKLYRRTWFSSVGIDGFAKAIEITYNKNTGLFHPHIHNILCCDPSAWLPDQRFFVSEWRDCLSVNYDPVVDIRSISRRSERHRLHEVSKYIFKSTDFLDGFDFIQFPELVYQIKGLRFASYGGVIKKKRRELCLLDVEKDDLLDDAAESVDIDFPILDWSFDFSSLRYGIH